MSGRIESLLKHMLEDAQDAAMFAAKAASYEAFAGDALIRKAVVMSLLNLGELAAHLPIEFTQAHPEIPWKSMIGMRNFAAHGYHILNLDVVWDTARTSIPELAEHLRSILNTH
jgi:uncharacterized protein with HEPN domain